MEALAHEVSEKTLRGTSATGRTQPLPIQHHQPNTHTLQQTQPLRPHTSTPPPKNNRSASKPPQDDPKYDNPPNYDQRLLNSSNYFLEPSSKNASTRQISSPKELLLKFIEAFLPASRRLE